MNTDAVPALDTEEGSRAPAVRAIKAVLDDQGRRIVVGYMDFGADAGRWWCEVCGKRPCTHIRAVRAHVAGDIP